MELFLLILAVGVTLLAGLLVVAYWVGAGIDFVGDVVDGLKSLVGLLKDLAKGVGWLVRLSLRAISGGRLFPRSEPAQTPEPAVERAIELNAEGPEDLIAVRELDLHTVVTDKSLAFPLVIQVGAAGAVRLPPMRLVGDDGMDSQAAAIVGVSWKELPTGGPEMARVTYNGDSLVELQAKWTAARISVLGLLPAQSPGRVHCVVGTIPFAYLRAITVTTEAEQGGRVRLETTIVQGPDDLTFWFMDLQFAEWQKAADVHRSVRERALAAKERDHRLQRGPDDVTRVRQLIAQDVRSLRPQDELRSDLGRTYNLVSRRTGARLARP